MESTKRRLLILVDWFDPGFKAGGPIRSAVNAASNLKDAFEIWIYTGDRDLGDRESYSSVEINKWLQRPGMNIFYASPELQSWVKILKMIRTIQPDVLYLNSMFSPRFSLFPVIMRRLGLLSSELVLAPRGMLRRSAIQQKTFKKRLFLAIFRLFGLHRVIRFQATDDQEFTDIKHWFGEKVEVKQVPNLPGKLSELSMPPDKAPGSLRMVFVGRIHPIKNLLLLLKALALQKAEIHLTVVAPIEDKAYWDLCSRQMSKLPGNVVVEHLTQVPHYEIEPIIRNSHIFALPTAGENFGHAIFEAIATGRPVLISDQTPWRQLEEKKAGWDLRITETGLWEKKISEVAAFDNHQMQEWCKGAWSYCKFYLDNSDLRQQYIKLLS